MRIEEMQSVSRAVGVFKLLKSNIAESAGPWSLVHGHGRGHAVTFGHDLAGDSQISAVSHDPIPGPGAPWRPGVLSFNNLG